MATSQEDQREPRWPGSKPEYHQATSEEDLGLSALLVGCCVIENTTEHL